MVKKTKKINIAKYDKSNTKNYMECKNRKRKSVVTIVYDSKTRKYL